MEILDHLPSDVVRDELGPMFCSKDLARLLNALPAQHRSVLAAAGGVHVADGPLDEAELAAFAAAGVQVQQFTGTFRENVCGAQLAEYQTDAPAWLKRDFELIARPCLGRALVLRRFEQLAATTATCRMVNGKLHARVDGKNPPIPARTMDLGHHGNFVLRRNEHWHHGRFIGAKYAWHKCAPS